MRVLVAGAGAIGQWLGARLVDAGEDVTLLLRPRFADAIEKDGLTVSGETDLTVRPIVATSVDAIASGDASFEVVLLTCKAHDTARLAEAVAPLVAQKGVLASLQNGLGNDAKLARVHDPDRCALALTSNGVMIEKPGHVRHAGPGSTTVGPLPRAREASARTLHALLDTAGLRPAWRADIRGALWTKAIVNSGINPVAALHGVRNGELLSELLWPEVEALVAEAHALSRAVGVPLDADVLAATRRVATETAKNRCSMLQDVQARKPTEIEQITGYLVRTGRRLGFPLPRCDDTYRAVKALEASYLGAEGSLRLTREEAEAWVAPA